MTPLFVALVVGVVLLAGTVNGVAGFGFALVATMATALLFPPATAVVLLIVPLFAVNLSLIGELDTDELRTCMLRFWPLVLPAAAGTMVGMVTLEVLPDGPLRFGLGVVTLAFVAVRQSLVPLPGLDTARDRCFVETRLPMAGVGAVSGLLFGGTNVGVQFVAYLKSCHLPHTVFVGVVAMTFLGINGLRIAVAAGLGLYSSAGTVALSVGLAVPAVLGVAVGKRVRHRISRDPARQLVLALLVVVGSRLVIGGLGIV